MDLARNTVVVNSGIVQDNTAISCKNTGDILNGSLLPILRRKVCCPGKRIGCSASQLIQSGAWHVPQIYFALPPHHTGGPEERSRVRYDCIHNTTMAEGSFAKYGTSRCLSDISEIAARTTGQGRGSEELRRPSSLDNNFPGCRPGKASFQGTFQFHFHHNWSIRLDGLFL